MSSDREHCVGGERAIVRGLESTFHYKPTQISISTDERHEEERGMEDFLILSKPHKNLRVYYMTTTGLWVGGGEVNQRNLQGAASSVLLYRKHSPLAGHRKRS